jgi:aminomethyltransferase
VAKKTPLHSQHLEAGAKIVDFAGWDMPLHYGSQLQEHHIVRQDAGVFDVSHMAIVDIEGSNSDAFLRFVLANDVAKLTKNGKALYTCMLNEKGGIIDDLVVYKLTEQTYRLVLNAGTRDKDLAWLHSQNSHFQIKITERHDLAMLAVQGPEALEKIKKVLTEKQSEVVAQLTPFTSIEVEGLFFARTGYTGEDGLEIQISKDHIVSLWKELLTGDIKPCGLGARDTLRLEAGLNLYGLDMDESTSPLSSNLSWTVAFDPQDRLFIGRKALEEEKKRGVAQKLVGIVLETPGVLRSHQKILIPNNGEGEITSGIFSPTLGHAIAFARIPNYPVENCEVELRNKRVNVRVVAPPFVRKGKKVFK